MAREDGGGREGRWEGWSEGVRKASMNVCGRVDWKKAVKLQLHGSYQDHIQPYSL